MTPYERRRELARNAVAWIIAIALGILISLSATPLHNL